jgi:ABC-type polar amino acid transport system ATPase subunit
MLSGKEIRKSYGKDEILHGVDLAVESGKITVLIGPSGGGKTTLLKALTMLDPPDTGTVSIDGIEYSFPLLQKSNLPSPWPKVTVVFQQLFLWPHMTLRQNITLPLRNGRAKIADNGYLDDLINLFEMTDFIDRYPNEVSLGQRQRGALARALVLNPSYILLDEITSALDVEQVGSILSHLQTLRDKGIGILIITHLINFAHRVADRIVFLDSGEILESGSRELIESPQNERVKKFLSVVKSAT